MLAYYGNFLALQHQQTNIALRYPYIAMVLMVFFLLHLLPAQCENTQC